MKSSVLHSDLDENFVADNDVDDFKIDSAQPVSDTFCEPVPESSRKMQLEHHQCVSLVEGRVKVSSMLQEDGYHRVATDLRNMGSEESLMELCLWTFRDKKRCHSETVFGVRR